ncbi:hypothetical protein DMX06_02450 [Pseudomonas mosselii]|nr:hypothetical protein DMX06_02450 [Pseudomonas mosselii]
MFKLCASPCRSGLVSRKGCEAAPGFQRLCTDRRGRFAALSRHEAAPTGIAKDFLASNKKRAIPCQGKWPLSTCLKRVSPVSGR